MKGKMEKLDEVLSRSCHHIFKNYFLRITELKYDKGKISTYMEFVDVPLLTFSKSVIQI